MKTIETYRGVVYPSQIDHMGHMNVQYYTSKFDEATWHLFSYLGMTNQYIKSNNRGMAALEQITKYKAEVMAGDLLFIKTGVLEVGSKTLRFIHTMYDAATNEEVSTSELFGVHIDRIKRKGCDFPEVIRLKCEEMIQSNTLDCEKI